MRRPTCRAGSRAPLPRRIAGTLEVESGANDPVAIVLTIGLLTTLEGVAASVGDWVWFGFWQLTGGLIIGVAVGIFSADFSVITQLIGIAAYGAVAFPAALIIFLALKATVGVRVTEEEERRGLDLSEHDMEAYPDYTIFTAR